MLRQLVLLAGAMGVVFVGGTKAMTKLCELTGALPKEEETEPKDEEDNKE